MKKTKKPIFISLILVMIFFSSVMMGCDFSDIFGQQDTKIDYYVIESPAYLKVVTTERKDTDYYIDYNKLALLCNNNPNASGYAFYAYGGNGNYNDLSLYTRFISNENYIELNKIFGEETGKLYFEQKVYHFYVVALGGTIGDKTYKDSSNSEIIEVEFKSQLNTPEIYVNAKKFIIGWQSDEFSSGYEIWEGADKNDLSSFEKITTITDLSHNYFQFEEYYNSKLRDLNFMIRILADNSSHYLNSNFSEIQTYVSSESITNPVETTLSDDFILSWEEIENADSYIITIDDTLIYETTNTTYDISEALSEAGSHTIYVTSKTSNTNYYVYPYKVVIKKEVYNQLLSPSDVTVSQSETNVIVEFTASQNANTYTLLINDTVVTNSLTQTRFSYSIAGNYNEDNTLKITIKANGYGYYLDSDFSEEVTFKFTQYLKTPVIKEISLENSKKYALLEVTKIDTKIYFEIKSSVTITLPVTKTIDSGNLLVKLDLTEYLKKDALYSIKVRSLSYNAYTHNSDMSTEFVYANNVPLDTPEITSITTSSNGAYIIVTWNEVNFANEYRVYANDEVINTTTNTTFNIPKSQIEELSFGGYYINVQAVGYGGYLDSILEENVYYKGYDKLDEPQNISVTATQTGFKVTWNVVDNAKNYVVYINNDGYDVNANTFTFETTEQKPYQIIIKACAPLEEDSTFSQKVMYNTTSKKITGYTDRYVYFDGWQDFYVTSLNEFNALCKYSFFAFEDLDIFINKSFGVTTSNVADFYQNAAKDFGTNSIEMSFTMDDKIIAGVNGVWLKVELLFTNGTNVPPTGNDSSSASTYQPYADQTYFTISEKTRSDDYNDFATEKSLIEVPVANTNQLYMCAQDGGKPVFAENNYEAEESYEKAKQILRNIINDDMTDFEKALAIYDYINANTVYDSEYRDGNFANRRYWLNGPLLGGVGVCDGLSKLYSLMCSMEGIKTIKITGFANGDHAWNKIYLDSDGDGVKEWHNVDVTWDGSLKITSGDTTYELSVHKKFLLSDEEFTDHIAYIDNNPTTVDTNYYNMYKYSEDKDLYITSVAEMKDYLTFLKSHSDTYNGRDLYVDVKVDDGSGNYTELSVEEVINQATSTMFNFNVQYITSETNYVIIFKR